MEFEQTIKNRHSVRKFTDQKVSLAVVEEILTDAQLAPSWVNSQPYRIHVAVGATLEKIRAHQVQLDHAGAKGAPDLPLMSRKLWSPQGQQNMAAWTAGLGEAGKLMADNAAQLYNAQVVLYLTLPKGYSEWSLYDLGALGNMIVLGATARGIGSMTAYQFIKYPQMLRQNVSINDDEDIIMGIGLGYRDDGALVNTIKSTRMKLNNILTIDK